MFLSLDRTAMHHDNLTNIRSASLVFSAHADCSPLPLDPGSGTVVHDLDIACEAVLLRVSTWGFVISIAKACGNLGGQVHFSKPTMPRMVRKIYPPTVVGPDLNHFLTQSGQLWNSRAIAIDEFGWMDFRHHTGWRSLYSALHHQK